MAQLDRYTFQGKRILFDATVTQVKAGATLTTPVSGSKSDSQGKANLTTIGGANSLNSTALSGDFGDLTQVIVIAPVSSTGTYPDVAIWPVVDGTDIQDEILLDASAEGNMMPNPGNTIGVVRTLGRPFREVIEKGMNNMPLIATGLKARGQYQFRVQSNAGWGNSGAAQTPLRIIGIGDKLNGQALDAVAELLATNGYPGAMNYSAPGYDSLVAEHSIQGGLRSATWTALPGGTAQQGVKVFRFFRYAYNAQDTTSQGQFVLSTDNAVKGAADNVSDNHGLGFDYTTSEDYLFLTEFGVRPGTHQAFTGFNINTTPLPDDNGFTTTAHVNPFAYGLVQPQRPEGNLYYAMQKPAWPVVASKNKLAFFITADGTAIPANSASVAIGGVHVQRGNG